MLGVSRVAVWTPHAALSASEAESPGVIGHQAMRLSSMEPFLTRCILSTLASKSSKADFLKSSVSVTDFTSEAATLAYESRSTRKHIHERISVVHHKNVDTPKSPIKKKWADTSAKFIKNA